MKKVFSILLVLIVAFSFTACQDASKVIIEDPTEIPEAQVENLELSSTYLADLGDAEIFQAIANVVAGQKVEGMTLPEGTVLQLTEDGTKFTVTVDLKNYDYDGVETPAEDVKVLNGTITLTLTGTANEDKTVLTATNYSISANVTFSTDNTTYVSVMLPDMTASINVSDIITIENGTKRGTLAVSTANNVVNSIYDTAAVGFKVPNDATFTVGGYTYTINEYVRLLASL